MLAIIFAIIITVIVFLICKDYYKEYKKGYGIFAVFIIVTAVIYIMISNMKVMKNFLYTYSEKPIYDNIIIVLLSMALANLVIGVFSIFFQKVYENIQVKKFENEYKSEEYEYYRDILKNESPAILSYCYNKRINVEDEVVATILNLNLKGIIELKEDTIIIKDESKLSNHEKFIFDNIKNMKENKKAFKLQLYKDMKRQGYVYVKDKKEVNIVSVMEIFMIWMIFYMLVTIPIFMELAALGVLEFVAYFLTFAGIPIYKLIDKRINPVVRTKKALELGGKLKGLRKYIKDYSNIKDNGINNMTLYEEYVIYAIIFNIKGKLDDEARKIYKNTQNIKIKRIETV